MKCTSQKVSTHDAAKRCVLGAHSRLRGTNVGTSALNAKYASSVVASLSEHIKSASVHHNFGFQCYIRGNFTRSFISSNQRDTPCHKAIESSHQCFHSSTQDTSPSAGYWSDTRCCCWDHRLCPTDEERTFDIKTVTLGLQVELPRCIASGQENNSHREPRHDRSVRGRRRVHPGCRSKGPSSRSKHR